MGQVVYLTGIPASGKTSLARHLTADATDPVVHISYAERLGAKLGAEHGVLRGQSAKVVTQAAVHETDEEIVQLIAQRDPSRPVVLDSHAVTYESYGLRAIPFTTARLEALQLSRVICLSARAEVISERLDADPSGRSRPSLEEIDRAARLQESIAAAYSLHLAIPLHVVDSELPLEDLAGVVRGLISS